MRVLTLVLLLMIMKSHAQKQGQERFDSLESVLAATIPDSARLSTLSILSFEYHRVNPEKGMAFGEKLYTLAHTLGQKKYMGYARLNLGANYAAKSDYPKALESDLKSIDIFEEINDSLSIAKVYNNIGNIYLSLNDLNKAREYYFKALAIYEKYHKKALGATAVGNIGVIYQIEGNINNALYMSERALKEFTEAKDKTGIARMNLNIGDLYDTKQEFVRSLTYKYNALQAYRELGEIIGIAKAYGDIGYSYLHLVTDSVSAMLPDSLSNDNILLDKAEYFVRKAIDLDAKYRYVEHLGISYEVLSKVLIAKNEHKKAIGYYRMSVEIRDSVFNNETKNMIKEIETRKSNELKERELEIKNLQIKSDRLSKIFLGSGLCFVLFFALFMYLNFTAQKRTNTLLNIEKKKSDDLLLNILPGEVAEELKTKGNSEAKQYNHVTVLFTDFVNFTGISAQLLPTDLVREIHKNFTVFDAIMEKYGLEKIKTIGDAYLAVCGLPNETKNHAQQVVKAALEIQQYIGRSDSKFQIRIGINSGAVVAGIVGVKKYAYDIWGDTVNTAARMEQNSETGKINISGSTYELVKDEFACEYRGKVKAKNKGEVDMYFVNV